MVPPTHTAARGALDTVQSAACVADADSTLQGGEVAVVQLQCLRLQNEAGWHWARMLGVSIYSAKGLRHCVGQVMDQRVSVAT
jgi:hypothetical protein